MTHHSSGKLTVGLVIGVTHRMERFQLDGVMKQELTFKQWGGRD